MRKTAKKIISKTSYEMELEVTMKYSTETLHKLAEKNGGRCFSEYKNSKTKYLWECAKGHQWEASLESIIGTSEKKPTWCGRCSGRIQTIEDLQNHAMKQEGKCLSVKYTRKDDKYLWECKQGHQWMATWESLFHTGCWCKICSDQKIIKNKSDRYGKLFIQRSTKLWDNKFDYSLVNYINQDTHVTIKCNDCGTVFERTPNRHLYQNQNCPECSRRDSLKVRWEDIDALVKKKNGILLTQEKNFHSVKQTKLKIQCKYGHIFDRYYEDINSKYRWCPICQPISIGEEICRLYMEKIFNEPFPKQKPLWLKTKEGNRLELDGYNENLKLAFEHHGEHHYSNKVYRKDNTNNLKAQIYRDKEKIRLCKKNNVHLIIIPELFRYTKIKDIIDIIKASIIKAKYVHKDNLNWNVEVDLEDLGSHKTDDYLIEANLIAQNNNGSCLSTYCISTTSHKLLFKCKKGHEWNTTLATVRNSWCPVCNANRSEKLSYEDAKKYLKNLNITSVKEFNQLTKQDNFPENIPKVPIVYYKNRGWVSYGDFLGTNRIADQFKKYKTYKEAEKFVQKLKLKSQLEWREYCKSGEKPADIPARASIHYKDKGWINWKKFLGNA